MTVVLGVPKLRLSGRESRVSRPEVLFFFAVVQITTSTDIVCLGVVWAQHVGFQQKRLNYVRILTVTRSVFNQTK
mgnify:CR=1